MNAGAILCRPIRFSTRSTPRPAAAIVDGRTASVDGPVPDGRGRGAGAGSAIDRQVRRRSPGLCRRRRGGRHSQGSGRHRPDRRRHPGGHDRAISFPHVTIKLAVNSEASIVLFYRGPSDVQLGGRPPGGGRPRRRGPPAPDDGPGVGPGNLRGRPAPGAAGAATPPSGWARPASAGSSVASISGWNSMARARRRR